MAKFSNIQLTQHGLDMMVNADNSKKVIYTKIGLGDGILTESEDVKTLNALKHEIIKSNISHIQNDSASQITLETVITNNSIDDAFYARELGVFAKLGEDGEEVLYAYANAKDTCDYIPDKSQPVDELKLKITLVVGNVENVTVEINPSIVFTTLEDCHREIQEHNISNAAHDNLARKDDVYTKTQTDNKLKEKADKNHGLHVPEKQTPSNSVFLRNDNTWQTITPDNIGAYHKIEVDSRLNDKVNKSGDTMTGALNFTNNLGTCLRGVMADTDVWRIYAHNGTGVNDGYLALDTADDGNEIICVRQFTGNFDSQVRCANLLDRDGTTSFPVSVTAPKFIASNGGFEGTATNAINFNGHSLSSILNLINAANTGIVEERLEQNGYVKFKNGLIIQWMNCEESNSRTDYKYFPRAFTRRIFYIHAMSYHHESKRCSSWVEDFNITRFICGLGDNYTVDVNSKNGSMFVLAIGI